VIVCGHYACGGVRAAIEGGATGALGTWLEHIRKIYVEQREALDLLSADERWDRVVELNTIAQVEGLRASSVVHGRGDARLAQRGASAARDVPAAELGPRTSCNLHHLSIQDLASSSRRR
jgi:hypothetical protein